MASAVRPGEDGSTLSIEGELDIACREQLESAWAELTRDSSGPVRVDLSGVTFIDSCFLRALVTLAQGQGPGSEVVLLRPSRPVTRLLELIGVDDVGLFQIEKGGVS